jgi:hypothetical protein
MKTDVSVGEFRLSPGAWAGQSQQNEKNKICKIEISKIEKSQKLKYWKLSSLLFREVDLEIVCPKIGLLFPRSAA